MQFEISHFRLLEDGSKRIVVKIPLKELIYFGYILESFEGWCNFTTIDKQKHLVQIDSCPDFEEEMDKLLDSLKKWRIT
jgi:hypothetical protein